MTGFDNELALKLYDLQAGGCLLAGIVLLLRRPSEKVTQAGAAALVSTAMVALFNAVTLVHPIDRLWLYDLMALPFSILVSTLWLYFDDLTSESPRRWGLGDLAHVAPAAVILLLSTVTFFSSPPASLRWIDRLLPPLLIVQAGVYIAALVIRLSSVGGRLKQLFSDTDHRQLDWVRGLGGLLLLNFALTAANDLYLWSGPELIFASAGLAFGWVMAICILRQAPVFAHDGQRDAVPAASSIGTGPGRYEKSRLDDERLAAIANKLNALFASQKVYLDPALSLRKIAGLLYIDEGKISQTFSRKMGTNFFDYVNGWRVRAAQQLILETEGSITDIAIEVGFNSRSAFYKAFRQETGSTPTDFRLTRTNGSAGTRPPSSHEIGS